MRRNGKEKKTTHTYDKQFKEFQENNGIQFTDSKLLKQAFTHSSYVNEHRANHMRIMKDLSF